MRLAIPHQQRLPLAIAALGFLFLGLFLLYPLFNVFSASVLDGEGEKFTFANYVKILGRPFYRGAVINTLTIGVAATITTILISVPFAFALARLPVPGKAAIIALAAMPLVLPSFVSAYAIVLLLGRAGIVTQWLQSWGIGFGSIYGAGGIVLVYTLTLYPYVLLPTMAAFKAVDVSVEEAAQSLGSSPRRTLWTVTLPIVIPAILAGGPAGLHRDPGKFRRAFRVGRGHADLRRRSLQAVRGRDGAQSVFGRRAGCAADRHDIAGAADPAALPVQPALRDGRTLRTADPARGAGLAHPGHDLLLGDRAAGAGAVLRHRRAVVHGVPRSGAPSQFQPGQLRRPLRAVDPAASQHADVRHTGGGRRHPGRRADRLCRDRACGSAMASLLDVIATLPFAVAGTVLAIGFVVSFNSGWLILTGGPFIMVLVYTVRKVPFAVRSSSAILHQIDPSLEEASISLGRSPLQTFGRILVPLMLGGILSGFVLTWVTIASELSATVVLYSGQWRTLTVVMFQALEGGGGGIATAAASTLIIVTLLPIALLYRLVRRYELST